VRADASRRNDGLLRILERVEADEPHAERLRRRQRRFDQACFGPCTEHQNAMRKQRADERQHHRVAHEQQSDERQRDRQQPFVIGGDRPRQQLRTEECERNADGRRKDHANDVRALRQRLAAPIQTERAVEADDRRRKEERYQCNVGVLDAVLSGIQSNDEQNRDEQP
jgi:hypothetical protein